MEQYALLIEMLCKGIDLVRGCWYLELPQCLKMTLVFASQSHNWRDHPKNEYLLAIEAGILIETIGKLDIYKQGRDSIKV